jgi:hypothetical protein
MSTTLVDNSIIEVKNQSFIVIANPLIGVTLPELGTDELEVPGEGMSAKGSIMYPRKNLRHTPFDGTK